MGWRSINSPVNPILASPRKTGVDGVEPRERPALSEVGLRVYDFDGVRESGFAT